MMQNRTDIARNSLLLDLDHDHMQSKSTAIPWLQDLHGVHSILEDDRSTRHVCAHWRIYFSRIWSRSVQGLQDSHFRNDSLDDCRRTRICIYVCQGLSKGQGQQHALTSFSVNLLDGIEEPKLHCCDELG